MTTTSRTDPVTARLIHTGLVGDQHAFEASSAVHAPLRFRKDWPWCLPSPTFSHPVIAVEDEQGKRHLCLSHPEARRHPFVAYAEAQIDTSIPDHCDGSEPWQHAFEWCHAQQLADADAWGNLALTRCFSTADSIYRAILNALLGTRVRVGKILDDIRALLELLPCPEPADPDNLIARAFQPVLASGVCVGLPASVGSADGAWAALFVCARVTHHDSA